MPLIKLPGLIDVHVHLRDPGQTHKENFFTGTSAALAGGYTTVLDMPNNKIPTTSLKRLNEKIKLANKKAVCDIGFYFGSLGNNLDEFEKVQDRVLGLKIYLNQTTGNYIVDERVFAKICSAWPKKLPILLHAEENIIDTIIEIGSKLGHRLHICHVSSKKELQTIIKAKQKGYKVTCGVTPHHLFLTKKEGVKLGPFGLMKPVLKSKSDLSFLWSNIMNIDVIESDHAPHRIEEKNSSSQPFGVPGLETTLPLMLNSVSEKRMSMQLLIKMCHENPKKIFNIKTAKNTYIEVDTSEKYVIDNKDLKTKCEWTPFKGLKVKGKLKRVFIRGKKVFEEGRILASKGFGRILN